jgi:hypothetical protein
MKTLLLTLFLVLLPAATANADVAPSRSSDKISRPAPTNGARYVLHTGLEISTDPKAYEAKLQISESDFKSFRAALDGPAGNQPLAAGIARSSTRTIIAGLLMFLAVSVAGVLFARSSSFGRAQKTVMGLVVVAVVLGAAAMITHGNAGPPGSYRWRNLPQALADGKPTLGGIDVEIVPDDQMSGRSMRLILPLKKQNSPGEE